MWSEYSSELKRQAEDWAALRRRYPDIPLVLAGDFNQNLDDERWYGNDETRALLRQALHQSSLVCVTEGDAIGLGMLKDRRLVDHICVSPELAVDAEFCCWERVDSQKVRMSDHPGVVAKLSDNRVR
jgi:endonuclease/exonuclease/phosphatase family metal-dependent hydrolase